MTKVLVDTDVLIDFLGDRKPYADYAERIFLLATENKVSVYTTAVILSNAYYILRKLFTHEKVISKLVQLCAYMRVINVTHEAVLKSLHSQFSDFEDALQNFAAEESDEVDTIITRNVKDFKYSSLSIMTPQDFAATLK